MSAASTTAAPVARAQAAGRPVDARLLRVLARVAHGEHLLGARPTAAAPTTASGAAGTLVFNRPDRHRPVTGSRRRATRGTTARKVTWSR